MITKVDPKYLMGKAWDDGTFYRVDMKSGDEHQAKILRFGCGLHFVFKTESKSFKIRYRSHFRESPVRFTKKQMVECSVVGYSEKTDEWYYLNTLCAFTPIRGASDEIFETDLEMSGGFDKYQACLPENGVSYDYEIESDMPIEFEHVDNTIILTGSSIAQFCNDCNHMNLCAYMYREYGVNVATVGISEYHTFANDGLMERLLNEDGKMIVVCDFEHCSVETYNRYASRSDKFTFITIDSMITQMCKRIKNAHNEIFTFIPPASWMYDSRHLNDHGIVEYSKLIMEKYTVGNLG